MPDLRIVSLISSATEIVHALGLSAFQVGRSHECDHPPAVLSLPVCSRPTFPVSGSSREIDRLVKEKLASALSIYELDTELIRTLNPTHILTQTQCKVCAVSLEDVERAFNDGLGTRAQVVALEPCALADLWHDIRRVASRCGEVEAGEHLVACLQEHMHSIERRAADTESRPRVAALEWLDPLMAAGNWIPELIALAGGENLFGIAGRHSPWMNWEQLERADPDAIVALPCGFDLARTRYEMHWLIEHAGWNELRAVLSGQVYLCDGNQFMNRPGPRLAESLRIFAEILHPEIFEASFEGIGWERL